MTALEIHQSFIETQFRVFVSNTQTIVLLVDKKWTALESALPHLSSWGFITAWNPSPEVFNLEENQKRNILLIAEVEKLNLRYLPALGIAANEKWSEESILIENISFEMANSLSQQFGQLAFVYGSKNKPAELVYTK